MLPYIAAGFLFPLLLVAGCAGAEAPAATRPATVPAPSEKAVTVVISLSITPGKPDAPSETVILRRTAGACSIRAVRAGDQGAGLSEATAQLDDREFADAWALVRRAQLTSFTPEEAGRAIDAPTKVLRIEWRDAESDSLRASEVSWRPPIRNERDAMSLARLLARLAGKHVPQVSLSYFPPQ